ncbi:MAG TPA: nickel-dependent hydrogenase large subunit [Verrucomicrobiota bacterium]|nr:nickel-dependent hydrogenase large subunit [Verrucomicrobiota bacterium]HNU50484.1 nickel-dependent hydrogenase large subunit [Verrucomicrobiota bacterium]
MPVITAVIDPITRIEGHLKVEVKVDTVNGVQQVVDAYSVGTLFRGFEKLLEGRDPRDATLITSRICGVCPTSHAHAAALALDHAYGVEGDTEARTAARLLRNLVHGACFIESAILHFYPLSLPDFIPGMPLAPWLPGWDVGRRLDSGTVSRFTAHFLEALAQRRHCHEMGAIYGGKLPHTPAFIMGGFTAVATAEDKALFQQYLEPLITWIEGTYVPDVELLASLWDEYQELGKGYGHLLAFGVFEQDNTAAPTLLLSRGRKVGGAPEVLPVDALKIKEQVRHSWYADTDGSKPVQESDTQPVYPKAGAYSWLKAPRYAGVPYEVGSLARMTVSGDYRGGVSVMDRHLARAREALKIALAMRVWLRELPTGRGAYTHRENPGIATSDGLTEAPRGALGHWLQVADARIAKYQVVTPTCWNLSPRDDGGQRGPLEQALLNLPVANVDQPIEVLRVVHSFDPCLDCATHVTRADPGATALVPQGLPT